MAHRHRRSQRVRQRDSHFFSSGKGTTSIRSASLTIASQTLTVTQSAMSCTYAISPSSNSFGAGAGTGTVNVSAPSGCAWTAASNATSFLSVTSGASGSGNGTVNYAVAANTTTSQRNGTLTVAGQTFTATQSAMSCTYAISPTSQNLSSDALRYSVNVTAPSGCAWTAVSNNTDWLSITSAASGSGNGTVTYSVTANSAAASRAGTITIAGQTFTATQAGVSTCGVQLSAGGFNFGYLSRQGSFQVSAAGTCSWNASASAPWITFNSGATGKGNGTVIFTIDTNTGAARTGTISVNGSSLIVNQSGSTTCTYAISPTSQNFTTTTSGTGTVNVTAGSGCAWTASSNAGWITISSGASGSGNGTVSYSVAANSGASRTGTMTVAGQTFTVSQAGTAPVCSVNLSTGGFNVLYASRQLQFTVQADSSCSWSATANVPWITFTSGAGKGNGTVTFLVSTNTGTARTGTITIGTSTLTVNQAGATGTLSVAPTSLAFGTISKGTSSVQGFTVSNVGQADLKVTSISIDTMSGTVTSFSQSNNCATVSPGGSCTVNLKYSPGGTGAQSTYLYIYSDGGSSKVPLTGTAR